MEEELDQQPYGNPNSAPNSLEGYRRKQPYYEGEFLGAYGDPEMYTEDGHLKAGDYIGKPIDWSPSNIIKRVLTFGAVGNEDKRATRYNEHLDSERLAEKTNVERHRLATQTIIEQERAERANQVNMAVEFLMGTDPNLSESAARQIANNHYASKLQADIATSGAQKAGAEADQARSFNDKVQAEVDRIGLAERRAMENQAKEEERKAALRAADRRAEVDRYDTANHTVARNAELANTELTNKQLGADNLTATTQDSATLGAILRAQEIARAQAGQRHFDAAGDADKAEAIKKLSEEAGLAAAEAQRNAARLDLASPAQRLAIVPFGSEAINARTGATVSRNTRGPVAMPGVDANGLPTMHYGIGNTDNYLPPNGQPAGLPGATNSMGTIPLGSVSKTPSGRIMRVNQ